MNSAEHLARVLPEMARAARNSVLTVDALHTLLAGLRQVARPGEFCEQLQVALLHLEEVRRGLPPDRAQAAYAVIEDACSRLAVALGGKGGSSANDGTGIPPAPAPGSPLTRRPGA